MYEDIHVVDFEFTIQNYMEVQEEKIYDKSMKRFIITEVYRLC